MTFFEKLEKHNRYCDEMMGIVHDLLSQVKEMGNTKESERLIATAEKITKSVEKIVQDFDIEHNENLEVLVRFVRDSKVARLNLR